jgi:hypothetical protein
MRPVLSMSPTKRMDPWLMKLFSCKISNNQQTRILNTTRHLESISTFSDYCACIGDLTSSPVRSPLHLASLSEPLRSSYTDGSPTTATVGLGIASLSSSSILESVRDEILWGLKQELLPTGLILSFCVSDPQ